MTKEEIKEIKKLAEELSESEHQILSYHARGFQSKEIGNLMGISFRTVENKTLDMTYHFEANNKAHLCAMLVEAGVITTEIKPNVPIKEIPKKKKS